MHAAAEGMNHYEKAMRFLLERGADLNARDDRGRTPLLAAVMEFKIFPARSLVTLGADINAVDNDGQSALSWAVSRNNQRMIEVLSGQI